ncbi:MAG: UDP-N-acetylmuramate dehydrogenase [bacterium]|nr:UDP-N-acetylmuramate dehydrogenase [bacterium]MDY2830318.1 UDP-N-acetylmuramate dehydrogenase [Alphaproteobacteria bacterium]
MLWFKKGKNSFLKLLPKVKGKYLSKVPLSKYTWFGVGGPAEVMFYPEDNDDLSWFIKNKPYNLPMFVIGGGSNLLVRDGGIPGVVIKLDTKFYHQWTLGNGRIICGAGMKNSELKKIMLDNAIGGLEFLVSIPGTLGGAVKTNAGCFGKELKDVLLGATVIDENGQELIVSAEDFNLRYRCSYFPEEWIVTSLILKTAPQDADETLKILSEHKSYRLKNQPAHVKTAGSTFKNPEGLKAWELIKKTGSNLLKVNGAVVSSKHCNFLVNTGKATASDIETLGNQIIEQVQKETSIVLEWEIKRVGVSK